MTLDEARKLLNLSVNLTQEVINRAFHKMALQYHPDRFQTFTQKAWATKKFIKISEARDLLMNNISLFDIGEEVPYTESTVSETRVSPTYEDIPSDGTRIEDSINSFSAFRWASSLFDKANKFPFPFDEIMFIAIFPIIMPCVLLSTYYTVTLFVITGVLKECGIEAYSDSKTKGGRFAYLLSITLISMPFLVAPWNFLTSHYRDVNIMRFCLVGVFWGAFCISVIIEWISFFRSETSRHSIEKELKMFSSRRSLKAADSKN